MAGYKANHQYRYRGIMKKDTFNFSQTRRLAATTEVIPYKLYKAGAYLCMQVLAATDLTSSPTRIDFGYQRGPDFVPLRSHAAPAAGHTVALDTEIFMTIDDVPAVRVVGGTVGDDIQLALAGYILYKGVDED
ncbi:MAG: hypothetical protein AB1744_00945 [Candidatus Zixiibacteriota bacterium]